MSKPTFTWAPDREAQLNQTPKVNVTNMGDGYEVRVPKGLNSAPEQWTVQFTMDNPTLQNTLQFIQARGGVESFYWMNPLGVTNLYVCRKWRTTHKGGVALLNFDFEQVFEATN